MEFLGGFLLLVALAVGAALVVGSIRQRLGISPTLEPSTPRPVTRSARPTTVGDLPRRLDGVTRLSYRTKDAKADYSFSYERQSDSTWRAYIVSQPGYGSRDEGAHPTHRLSDGSRKFVCWSAPIPSLDQAKQVSALWADATQEYIRSGKRF